jgi:hypothetical protein
MGFVFADLVETVFAPSTLYVRAFVLVPATFDQSPAAMMLYEQDGGASLQIALNLDSQTLAVYGGLDDHRNKANRLLPADKWECVEWSVTVGSAGSYTVKIDDTEVASATGVKTLPDPPAPAFKAVAVGLGSNINMAREIWLDEIMIDSKPIGCAN